MSAANNGGPAFPSDELFQGAPVCQQFHGMTLRDYFAAKALQGICAHDDNWGCNGAQIAQNAYGMADAMLAERAK